MKHFLSHSLWRGLSAAIFLLLPICASAQTAERERTMELKITSKEVSAVQEELKDRGYYQAKPNGILDQETRAALRRYQAEHGLAESGRIDRATLDKLEIEYPVTGKKKERPKGIVAKVGYGVKDTAVSTGKTVGGATKTVVRHGKNGVEKTVEVTSEAAKKIKQ
jgi:peptidoglycan hydrolase-like protein with peptidoglycan-binding domain